MPRFDKETLEAFWDKIDSDGSGELSGMEFRDAALKFRESGEPAPNDRLVAEMLSSMDDDGSKTVSKAEFMKHVNQAANDTQRIEEAFKAVDSDGSGCISRDELKSLLEANGIKSDCVDEMLKLKDVDGDGRISLQEFMEEF